MVNIGILIFDHAVVLDFSGPYQVFHYVSRFTPESPVTKVFTIGMDAKPINAQGLSLNPAYTFENCPDLDLLLIPGGKIESQVILDWIRYQATQVKHVLSVCTAALHLGSLGLLDGLRATTHAQYLDELKQIAPAVEVVPASKRYVDNGRFILSAGIAAGIDMSLYVVSKLWGNDVAHKIANFIEYKWEISET